MPHTGHSLAARAFSQRMGGPAVSHWMPRPLALPHSSSARPPVHGATCAGRIPVLCASALEAGGAASLCDLHLLCPFSSGLPSRLPVRKGLTSKLMPATHVAGQQV